MTAYKSSGACPIVRQQAPGETGPIRSEGADFQAGQAQHLPVVAFFDLVAEVESRTRDAFPRCAVQLVQDCSPLANPTQRHKDARASFRQDLQVGHPPLAKAGHERCHESRAVGRR